MDRMHIRIDCTGLSTDRTREYMKDIKVLAKKWSPETSFIVTTTGVSIEVIPTLLDLKNERVVYTVDLDSSATPVQIKAALDTIKEGMQ